LNLLISGGPIYSSSFLISMFFLSICVTVIFILFWICIRIRNVFLLPSFAFRYFSIYGFQEFFFIYLAHLLSKNNIFFELFLLMINLKINFVGL